MARGTENGRADRRPRVVLPAGVHRGGERARRRRDRGVRQARRHARWTSPCRYAVLVDRISHEVPYYRSYLKHAVLQGVTVVNNPFMWTADDKFFGASLAHEARRRQPEDRRAAEQGLRPGHHARRRACATSCTRSTGRRSSTTSGCRASSRTRTAAAGGTCTSATRSRS